MWSGIFAAIGVASFLACILQLGAFGVMGARLARRVRELTFGALLRQASHCTSRTCWQFPLV